MASWWILGGRCTAPYAWTASALTGRLATSEPGSNKQDALAGSRPRGVAAASTVTAAPEMGTTSLVTGLAVPATVLEAPAEEYGVEARDWAASFQSQRLEYDYWIHDVEGRIPAAIRGTLFRNGPGRFERGDQHYNHMLDGDGYVCSFSFARDGRVQFKSRFVRTREFMREEETEQVLYRNTFGTQRPGGVLCNAFDLKLKNPANTNVMCWGNRLLALWEAGAPYELHPYTLATRPNPETLDGFVTCGLAPSTTGHSGLDKLMRFGTALTAHPHIEPARPGRTERMVIWRWASRSTRGGSVLDMSIAEYDSHWNRLEETKVELKDACFAPHDFGITPKHFVFFQSPTSFDMVPFLLGMKGPAQCVDMSAGPLRVNVVPRNGRKPVVISTEPTFAIHHANAFEQDGEIHVWSSGWGPEGLQALGRESGMLGSWKAVLQGNYDAIPHTSIWRHRINLATQEVVREVLFEDQNAEHPQVNPRWYSRPTRYMYCNMSHHPDGGRKSMPPQAFGRLDTRTGECEKWFAGPRAFCEELKFVPGPNADTVEDNGYLMGMVFDAESNRSSLVIMDASDFSKGPIARLWLTHHVPHGLHGCYSERYYGP